MHTYVLYCPVYIFIEYLSFVYSILNFCGMFCIYIAYIHVVYILDTYYMLYIMFCIVHMYMYISVLGTCIYIKKLHLPLLSSNLN